MDATRPTLYLMMGLPGAGKTTAAKVIAEITGTSRVSSDEERLKMWPKPKFSLEEHAALYAALNQKTADLLQTGKSVVYDANLNRKIHRQEKYDLAKKFGAETKLIWVNTDHPTAKSRRLLEVQHHQLVPSNEDPGSMFERIASLIEPPTNDEKPIVLDGTKITKDYVKTGLQLN